ncbi:hypothetical protein [Sphingomonas sp.]|uniref:hypothetical protein n=1 Tax=Sphingomonas sp. TaxID=28214 RepID=UPI003B0053CE
MVQTARSGVIPSVPLIGGASAGAVVAIVFGLLPTHWLERGVELSGIAAVLPVAAPPLGLTARAVLALGGGVGVAAIVWAALYLVFGPGAPFARRIYRTGDGPAVRRADAHPDAPPRRPVTAAELTAATVELALPRDLDVPLAAFDPAALPDVPRTPARPVKSLAPALAPGERLETFVLTPPPPVVTGVRAEQTPSIDALLRRLEQGARRRVVA